MNHWDLGLKRMGFPFGIETDVDCVWLLTLANV